MDVKTFKTIASKLPPHIAVLMRGPTGVGKSALADAVASELGLPFIDVRGSTMSEGDVGGYPDIEGMKKNGIMTFCMPSWFIRACREPVVLMLDELNRSLPGVQQSFFQLVLDRELGNDEDGVPYRLHPDTRVLAAINHGSEYDVNDMDPALLRRFWVVDLKPSHEDFLIWAEGAGLDAVLIDFIRQNAAHLRVDPSEVEPGTVCPNPASWHRLNDTLVHMELAPVDIAGQKSGVLYSISQGFVGTEAAIAFNEFVSKYASVISAEDVLERFDVIESQLKKSLDAEASSIMAVIDKLGTDCVESTWTTAQVKNLEKFFKLIPGEMVVQLWNKITESQNLKNIQKIHKKVGSMVVREVREARELKS